MSKEAAYLEGVWTGWRSGLAGEQMDDAYARQAWERSDAAHLTPNTDLSDERAREVLLQHFGVSDEGVLEPILRAMHQYAAGLQGEVERLRLALHEIDVEAANTIPPDGKDAAFAALNRITAIINPFRLPRTALGDTQS